MKIRLLDRILVAVAGLILIAMCGALVAQVFFQVDIIGLANRALHTRNPKWQIMMVAGAVILLVLGVYCFLVLFRHRRKKDRFILQKTENGELAISLKALSNMVDKCLEQHAELEVQGVHLENQKEGLLVDIHGNVAGGVSIPLTIEALQKQIRQYVTACSGVEVKGVRVKIEASGPDAENAPFAIAAPTRPLLQEAAKSAPVAEPLAETLTVAQSASETGAAEAAPARDNAAPAEPAAEKAEAAPSPFSAAPVPASGMPVEDEDDRPIHQRLFSVQPEPCIVPAPPEMNDTEAEAAGEETAAEAPAGDEHSPEEPAGEGLPADEAAPAETEEKLADTASSGTEEEKETENT